MFAYTRTKDIKSFQYLTAQTAHALRQDKTSQSRMREGAVPGTAMHLFREAPSPATPETLKLDAPVIGQYKPNYVESFKKFKSEKGAAERKGAKLGLHILCGVSTDWMTEAGDLHDPKNPNQRKLMDAAVAWVNSWSDDGVFDARIDLDETGGAVVDLFVAPTAIQNHKSGKSKKTISVNKALEALSIEMNLSKSKHLSALNSSWAKYAQANLDSRLTRGTPKSETKKEHIPPDQYREMMERATKAEADAEALRKRAVELEASTQQMVDTAVEDAVKDAKAEAERLRNEAVDLKASTQQMVDTAVKEAKADIEELKAETVALKNSMKERISAAVTNAVHITVGLTTGIFTNEFKLNPETKKIIISRDLQRVPGFIDVYKACIPSFQIIRQFWDDANDRMPPENVQAIKASATQLQQVASKPDLRFQDNDLDDDSPSM